MKNLFRKFIGILVVSLLIISSINSVFAEQKDQVYSQENYTKIIESLSKEYGLEIRAGKPENIDDDNIQVL